MQQSRFFSIRTWLIGVVLVVITFFAVLAMVGLPSALAFWKEHKPVPKVTVDSAMRTEVIDTLVARLNEHYVFPEKARQMETLLRHRQQRGEYNIADAVQFAAALSADLDSVARDKHMRIDFSADEVPDQRALARPALGQKAPPEEPVPMRWINAIGRKLSSFGVEKVEQLPSGIGYIALRGFSPPYLAGQKYAAAMDELADTSALIIDLRDNGGGWPDGVVLLESYFFDKRTHVNSIWWRDSGKTEQFWTHDKVDGPKYGQAKKVFLLTSRNTRSAGEDFAYSMQALKRATIIGEPTWGGAHPTSRHRLAAHFVGSIPDARSIHPITNSNWERTGVVPDIAVAPAQALRVAQQRILSEQLLTEKSAQRKADIRRALARL